MKVRQGFVSNSSSSSFILVAREPITRELLEREYGWLGAFGRPLIDWLEYHGDDELAHPEDLGCITQGLSLEGMHYKEYAYTNQGEGEISAAFYYVGYGHLATDRITVIPGTYMC